MRNSKAYAFLSVVVLAVAVLFAAMPVPTAEAQFASNNRSVRLRETAAANVATPASGYANVFRDSTYGSFQVKDSAGLLYGIMGKVSVTTLAVTTTLTDAHLGEVVVYDGAASATLALPEITASNIGMVYEVVALDADDLIVTCVAADSIVDSTDATVDADDSITASTVGASARFVAISATQWLIVPVGTWAIS